MHHSRNTCLDLSTGDSGTGESIRFKVSEHDGETFTTFMKSVCKSLHLCIMFSTQRLSFFGFTLL